MHIDIWSDIACPWCFIGLTRFQRALASFDSADEVSVTLHSFQLDPTIPDQVGKTEVEYLAERKGMPLGQARALTGQVTAAAAPDGLILDFESVVVANSRRAHRLIQHANQVSPVLAWDLELALFAAHFQQGLDINDGATLVKIGVDAGLAADDAAAALDSNDMDSLVATDVDLAATLGIRGVPFFVLEQQYGISGAQPVAAFTQALSQIWAKTRP